MTIAEIHGKLFHYRNPHDRMEDLLTSDVFGTMKYAGWQYGFMEWLRSALDPRFESRTADGVLPRDAEIDHVDCLFWDELPNSLIPDVQLIIRKTDGNVVLVIVEAKYLSGPSNRKVSEDESVPALLTGNQLADQINGFPKGLDGEDVHVTGRIHIYLTAHYSCPLETYREAEKHLNKNHGVKCYWLNWYSLKKHLESAGVSDDDTRRFLLSDLMNLLFKKDLIPFEGFRHWPSLEFQHFPGFWKDNRLFQRQPPDLPRPCSFWRRK